MIGIICDVVKVTGGYEGSELKDRTYRFFKKREQFTDSVVASNKTKNLFKLQEDFMDTMYFFHSANSLTLNTVCVKYRLSR